MAIHNKTTIQRELDATLVSGKWTEILGEIMLEFASSSVAKRGLYYRYSEFEIDFIIKPRIVDMLLLKSFSYDKANASAYTFFSKVTHNAIIDAIKDIRRAERGDSAGVFYIEEVGKELSSMQDDSEIFISNDVYIENGIIKLK